MRSRWNSIENRAVRSALKRELAAKTSFLKWRPNLRRITIDDWMEFWLNAMMTLMIGFLFLLLIVMIIAMKWVGIIVALFVFPIFPLLLSILKDMWFD